MRDLVFVAVAGFCASLVDGALGMGFGPTSSSILLGTGLTPASVSTTVNLAKVLTGFASAISHWRFGNVDRRLVLRLAIPGALGAIIGVTVLSNVDASTLKPVLAGILVLIALRILWRFSAFASPAPAQTEGVSEAVPTFDDRGVEVAAVAGGVTNGMIGSWGPVVTPFLMHRGLAPRYAVGSVNTAEVVVATMSATSLIASMGSGGLNFAVVAAMLAGGILAAPVAAWFVRHVPARPMGIAVAALLLLTNARELAGWAGLGAAAWGAYVGVVVLVALAALRPRLQRRSARHEELVPATA